MHAGEETITMAKKRRRAHPTQTASTTVVREGSEYGIRGEAQRKPDEKKGKDKL